MLHKLIVLLCLWMFACVPPPAVSSTPTTSSTDIELEAAIEQARASLDTFLTKIRVPHADRTFVALKVRFTPPGESPQDIWVDAVTYTDGVLRGNVGDD